MNRPIDPEDLAVWPNGDYIEMGEIESYGRDKSDDYEVIPWDSTTAAIITGDIEHYCMQLFGHPYWQVLNDENVAKLIRTFHLK